MRLLPLEILKMQPRIPSLLTKFRWSIVFGASLFSTGILLLILKTCLLEFLTASFLVLKPHSMLDDVWRKSPIEIPTVVYFFNWTNPEQFRNPSTKPKFQEVGPYRFMQSMEKVNVVWNDNDTVTFNQLRTWRVDTDSPNGNLSDKINTLNAVTMATSHYVRDWPYVLRKAISVLFAAMAPQVNVTRTVNQLLFEGYEDIVVDLANYLPFIASEIPRFDKFAWLRLRNGTSDFDGVFNMATGANGNFELMNWNYFDKTPYFDGECARVRGSGGELYPTKLKKDHIRIFVTDICRDLRLDFEEEVTVSGIVGYKYSIGDGVLDNGTLVPGNECYCAGDCLPSGMLNVSSCRYGLPTYVSLPNFYRADPVYLDAVEGLHPEKSKHEAYIILEPNTGVPLNASMKIQLNFLIHPIDDISVFQDVPRIYFPLLWAEQKAELPSLMIIMLKLYLNAPLILTIVAVVMTLVGLCLLICLAYKPMFTSVFNKTISRRRQPRPLTPEEVPLQYEDKEEAYVNLVLKDECT